jgi:oligo-alginate lyase
LPGFNDSRVLSLYDQAPLYEYAYSMSHDPRFAAVITHGEHATPDAAGLPFGGGGSKDTRNDMEALLFGADTVPVEPMPQLKSTVFPNAGYAALRSPANDWTEILKFGPHGAGHGHNDKLSEVIFAEGATMSVDPGTQFYGVPSHNTWDHATVAHNTVVVDEKSQAAATGKLLAWQTAPDFTAVDADAGPIYPGVSLRRRVVLTPRYILEITDATATDNSDHTFDWVYHNFGRQDLKLATQVWTGFPQSEGYQHLVSNQSATTSIAWHDQFTIAAEGSQPARGMHLWMLGGTETRVIEGLGLGPDLKVPVPYVMARRRGRNASFAALMEPYQAASAVTGFERSGDNEYVVRGNGWTDTITLGPQVKVQHRQ